MTEAEFLKRFDRHLELGNAGLGEVKDALHEVREEMALSRGSHEDMRTFIRDLTRRNEKVLGAMVEELSEMRDQIRANTQAVLAVLDRLPPAPQN